MTMQFRYVGAISFLDSADKANDSRITNVMGFRVASDWLASVEEFYRAACNAGDYDGSEVLITIFGYAGPKGEWAPVTEEEFGEFADSDTLVQEVHIRNPYYA